MNRKIIIYGVWALCGLILFTGCSQHKEEDRTQMAVEKFAQMLVPDMEDYKRENSSKYDDAENSPSRPSLSDDEATATSPSPTPVAQETSSPSPGKKEENKEAKNTPPADNPGGREASKKSEVRSSDPSSDRKGTSAASINWKELDSPSVTLSRISQIENEAKAKGIVIPAEYKTRIVALRRAIATLQNAMRPSTKGLSDEQSTLIQRVWDTPPVKPSYPNQKNLFKNIQSIAGCAPVVTKAKKAEGMK